MHNPNIGRWLQVDPIGFEAGDTNLYRYVGNNPTNYTDPSGLDYATDQQGRVYWVIQHDAPGVYNPVVRWVHIGDLKNDGRVQIIADFGGGYLEYSDLRQFVRNYWNEFPGGMAHAPEETQNLRIRLAVTRLRGGGQINTPGPCQQYVAAAGGGVVDGGAMFANAFIMGLDPRLNDYVTQQIQDHGTLYRIANVSMHIGLVALEGAAGAAIGQVAAGHAGILPVPHGTIHVPAGHSRVYRAVSEAEYEHILRTGRFAQGPNSMEGKWFADTLEGAHAHGRYLYPQGNYRIIEADVPNNAPSLFRMTNLDNRGPARFLHIDDLVNVRARPLACQE